ncbi:MAG: DNA repair protein RadC [Bacteroidetes bacterium]|nr:DNA repair protein RadC [Bacteroidota bacterium]
MENYQKRTPITQWAEDDKPREKLLLKGKASLSDAELLAILIRSGSARESAVDLSKSILHESSDNLIELSRKSVHELMKFSGVGEAKALSIVAALELGKRRRNAEALEKPVITTSKDAFERFYAGASDLNYEQFWVMMLDQANKVLRVISVSEGGLTGTVADPKKIFKQAIEYGACNIILCHNHPSGQLKPSDADIRLTKKMVQSGELIEIKVLDHLIIGGDSYYSFADNGLI